jgi:hypothetical protein
MWWEALSYYWENAYKERISLKSALQYSKSAQKFDAFSALPILIGGCGRSGTTLLLAILGAHPNVSALDFESGLFTKSRFQSDIQKNHAKNLASIRSFLAIRGIEPTANRWCEKTPKNVRNLEAILQAFGAEVQIILMCRDGRDTVTSIHPEHEGYFISPQDWIADTERTLAWKQHPQVKVIKYEKLILDFDNTISDLMAFLNLPEHESLANFSRHTSVQKNRAWKQGVQPIKANSIGKWKLPEHEKVVQSLLDLPRAKELLAALDYR